MVFRLGSDYTCQVPGCNADLLTHKKYNQRCRICREHQTALAVCIDEMFTRYCQQCALMQPLEDFQGEQRSCISALDSRRRRLYLRSLVTPPANIVSNQRPGDWEQLYSVLIRFHHYRMQYVMSLINLTLNSMPSELLYAACLQGHNHVDSPAQQETSLHSSDSGVAQSNNVSLW